MKQVLALAVGVFAAAAIAQAAMAGNDSKVTLGPSGYDAKGKSELVVAGAANVVLEHNDRVVVCRAKQSGWQQSARPAEHALEGNDAAGDIVPPYVVVSKKGDKDTSLAAGQNWTPANAAMYANGCNATSSTPSTAAAPVAAPAATVTATTVIIKKIVVRITTTQAKKAVKKAKKHVAKRHAAKRHAAKKHKAAKKHAVRKINRGRQARDTNAVPHRR